MKKNYFVHKYIILIFILYFAFSKEAANAAIETDKAAHFGLSSVGVEALIKSCNKLFSMSDPWSCHLSSSAVMFGIGLIKELGDSKKQNADLDSQDLLANSLGILTGNILQYQF